MSQTATVAKITPTTKGSQENKTEIDIVVLHWEGKAYCWEGSRGEYTVGQQVSITPPVSTGANITLA